MDEAYADYLRSDTWQEKRERVLNRDNRRCRICGSRDALRAHHLIYRSGVPLGEEPDDDLITLCERCHHDVHALEKSFRDTDRAAAYFKNLLFDDLVLDVISARDIAFGGDLKLSKYNRAANFYVRQIKQCVPVFFGSKKKHALMRDLPDSIQLKFNHRRVNKLMSIWEKTKDADELRKHGASAAFVKKIMSSEKDATRTDDAEWELSDGHNNAKVSVSYEAEKGHQTEKDVARIKIEFENEISGASTYYGFKAVIFDIKGYADIQLFKRSIERAAEMLEQAQANARQKVGETQ